MKEETTVGDGRMDRGGGGVEIEDGLMNECLCTIWRGKWQLNTPRKCFKLK